MTAHQQPHWFLWVSGLTCKTEPPCLLVPSPLPPSSIGQLLQLESSARVYFHGWGAKTALSLFWLPCRSQWRRRGVLRTGAEPHRGHVEEDGGGLGVGGCPGMGPSQTGCEGSSRRVGVCVEAR